MNQCFRLYTWQLPDWDITREHRDPSKGFQAWRCDTWPRLQLLYSKLEERIGTLDFLWCFAKYEYWYDTPIRKLWELDVPSSEIFHFLDSDTWETMRKNAENGEQPAKICWDELIIERNEGIKRLSTGNKDNITPLVRLLVPSEWTDRSRSRFSNGPAYVKYKDLPTSECEAKRCRDEGPKRGAWRQR
ncbi:hypothetical protein KA005_42240 [bacterium]|nr:hypothetical protein [bacterium]